MQKKLKLIKAYVPLENKYKEINEIINNMKFINLEIYNEAIKHTQYFKAKIKLTFVLLSFIKLEGLTSTNYKDLGILYLLFGFIFILGIIGTLFSILIRIELANTEIVAILFVILFVVMMRKVLGLERVSLLSLNYNLNDCSNDSNKELNDKNYVYCTDGSGDEQHTTSESTSDTISESNEVEDFESEWEAEELNEITQEIEKYRKEEIERQRENETREKIINDKKYQLKKKEEQWDHKLKAINEQLAVFEIEADEEYRKKVNEIKEKAKKRNEEEKYYEDENKMLQKNLEYTIQMFNKNEIQFDTEEFGSLIEKMKQWDLDLAKLNRVETLTLKKLEEEAIEIDFESDRLNKETEDLQKKKLNEIFQKQEKAIEIYNRIKAIEEWIKKKTTD